jgi:hypothetical protein
MKKKQTYAPANPRQGRKFIEAAKGPGVDADDQAFRQAKRALVRAKPSKQRSR